MAEGLSIDGEVGPQAYGANKSPVQFLGYQARYHIDRTLLAREAPGDKSEVEPPVPIPNTEVKRLSADNTGWATARKDRPPPGAAFFVC